MRQQPKYTFNKTRHKTMVVLNTKTFIKLLTRVLTPSQKQSLILQKMIMRSFLNVEGLIVYP